MRFIENLLDAARIQSESKLTPNYKPIELRAQCKFIKETFEPLAKQKDLDLTINIDPEMPETIQCDPDWLRQIASNLITNAIKFTKSGGITIDVRPSAQQCWSLRIQDTGIGLEPDHLKNIFTPFWQVDGSTTRTANRGVGLGLSIVHELVIALEGTINVESQPNHGTIFTITLPLKSIENQ